MATNRDQIVRLIRTSATPLDDDQIARELNISQRQQVNVICRTLADDGLIVRRTGSDSKLVNIWVGDHPEPDTATEVVATPEHTVSAGSSHEQRRAEAAMLGTLSTMLGVELRPTPVTTDSGARVELDGADQDLTVLVECWAHQGPPKVGQKQKLLSDALKLSWIASTFPARPRLILCLTDQAAARPFLPPSRSWATQALADLGIEIVVIELPKELRQDVAEAQRRQVR